MTIARHTLYNTLGAVAPTAVTLVTVPLYIKCIGDARYGILAIVWLLLGYFGVFDLGLSRATANQIAKLQNSPANEREEIFWTACAINLIIGSAGALFVYVLGLPLLGHWIKMSPALRVEATATLPWLAVAIPIATFTGVLTGTLEGQRHFGLVNALQAAGTILFQGAPLIAAYEVGPTLQTIIPVAVVVRVISVLPLAIAVKFLLPLSGKPRIHLEKSRYLLSYGGWVSITNLLSPLLESLDRVLIGVALGANQIAYYAVPFSLVQRSRILPYALSRTLFPYLSADDERQAKKRAFDSVLLLAAVAIPVTVMGMLAMRPFLVFWLGNRFASHAAPIGVTLLCAMWLNGLASIPFALLQAQGRPDIVAKFHLIEFLPFVALLWYCLHRFGVLGAAIVWSARGALDALLLFLAASLGKATLKAILPGIVLTSLTWIYLRTTFVNQTEPRLMIDAGLILAAVIWSISSSPLAREKICRVIGERI